MKKILAALTVVVLAAGSAMAAGHMGGGMGAGCCDMGKHATPADTAAHKKFMSDTMSLRQEMMNKKFELQKEFVKEMPDAAVMAKLQGEVKELRTKLMDARAKSGLPMGHMGKKGHKMKGGMGMMDCPMMADPAAVPAAK